MRQPELHATNLDAKATAFVILPGVLRGVADIAAGADLPDVVRVETQSLIRELADILDRVRAGETVVLSSRPINAVEVGR